ncbi:MAG: TonB-dependent receptor [Chitinophagaceae bacterium]|nr:MAG: TonB-dependent receptor [Chitinophagaceae bacterium]
MKKILALLLLSSQAALAQHSFTVRVTDDHTHLPVSGAVVSIPELNLGNYSDSAGLAILTHIPEGLQRIRISRLGYETKNISINSPQAAGDTLQIELEPSEQALHEVIISTTRNNTGIQDIPVRVEIIGADDINEKIGSTPANVSELLGEANGIQVLPASTSTGNVSVRIEGLQGQYTQLLRDGFPMYGGFSGGLSILQIPPLNLKRVEIIKGASSALYGGDAIAGLINFITKKPGTKPHFDFLLNQSQRGASDISSFFSRRKNNFGITLLATYDRQSPNDINHDGFADIPQSETVTFNPTLFYYFNDSTTLSLSLNATSDNRKGGDLYAIKYQPDSVHNYLEHNLSQRDYYQLNFEKHFSHGDILTIKNSLSYYKRQITLPDYAFGGTDVNSYSEISYLLNWKKNKTVAGVNLLTDNFRQNKQLSLLPGDYSHTTSGAFIQDDWDMFPKITMEAGFRGDEQNKYGFFALPRFAVLYKINPGLSARIGGGMGYQIPTIFNILPDQSDFSEVLPINNRVSAITSKGANLDLHYVTDLTDELSFAYDQTFFITRINNPVIPQTDSLSQGIYYFENAAGPEVAKGFESNFTFDLDDWEFVADYTYTNSKNYFDKIHPFVPLNPISKILLTLVYEKENNFRTGVEWFYSGRQYLSDGSRARNYWTMDLVGEKTFHFLSLIANIENLFDVRQSRFSPLVFPPYNHPSFAEIYAPVEGIIVNLEMRIRF